MSNKKKTTSTKDDGKPALVPKLRFPEFRDAEGWEQTTLGDVARLKNGYAFKSSEYVDFGPFQIITIANVQQGELSLDATKRIAELPSDIQAHQRLSIGDILISMTGNVGRICRVTCEALLLNQRVGKLMPEGITPDFFYHLIQRDEFRNSMQLKAAGGAQGNLSGGDITDYALHCPAEEPEQQKIAECLSSVDELMAAQSRKVDALKTHKKGLMQQLFPREGETQPRLRFPEFQDAGEWDASKLGKHVEIQSGYSPSAYSLSSKGKYAFVKVEDLNNCIKYQVLGREFCDDSVGVVPKNSILFPKRGAAIELNKIRITATEILIDTNLMALTPKDGLTVEFLYYYLNNVGLSQIADTSTIPQINNKHITPFDLLLPVEAEQQRIASCLSSLDALIAAENQKLNALKTHKKALMQQLFPSPEEIES